MKSRAIRKFGSNMCNRCQTLNKWTVLCAHSWTVELVGTFFYCFTRFSNGICHHAILICYTQQHVIMCYLRCSTMLSFSTSRSHTPHTTRTTFIDAIAMFTFTFSFFCRLFFQLLISFHSGATHTRFRTEKKIFIMFSFNVYRCTYCDCCYFGHVVVVVFRCSSLLFRVSFIIWSCVKAFIHHIECVYRFEYPKPNSMCSAYEYASNISPFCWCCCCLFFFLVLNFVVFLVIVKYRRIALNSIFMDYVRFLWSTWPTTKYTHTHVRISSNNNHTHNTNFRVVTKRKPTFSHMFTYGEQKQKQKKKNVEKVWRKYVGYRRRVNFRNTISTWCTS